MVASLKDVISKATDSFFDTNDPKAFMDYPKWVMEWPGQAVLTASSIAWTSEATEAIHATSENENAMRNFLARCNARLEEVVRLVRKSSELSQSVRKTLRYMSDSL